MIAAEKKEIIKKTVKDIQNTGAPEVQVALLTQRIKDLTEHLKKNHKDEHSRYGMKKLISQRKKMLSYLKKVSNDRYQDLLKKLNLRR